MFAVSECEMESSKYSECDIEKTVMNAIEVLWSKDRDYCIDLFGVPLLPFIPLTLGVPLIFVHGGNASSARILQPLMVCWLRTTRAPGRLTESDSTRSTLLRTIEVTVVVTMGLNHNVPTALPFCRR